MNGSQNTRIDSPTPVNLVGVPVFARYLELVDWTGRALREGKRGAIRSDALPILERLNIEPQYWLFLATQFESRFKRLVGTAYKLKAACATLGYQRTPGLAACRELLT